MTLISIDESSTLVRYRRQWVRKHEVPLGRVYIENGLRYQTSTVPGTFESVKVGGRFRHLDRWCIKVSERDAEYLKPNLPFGARTRNRILPELEPGRQVDVLRVDERDTT